jgi:hypothetical protein
MLEQAAHDQDAEQASYWMDTISKLANRVSDGEQGCQPVVPSDLGSTKESCETQSPSDHEEAVVDDSPIVSSLPSGNLRFARAIEGFVDHLDPKLEQLQISVSACDVEKILEVSGWIRDSSRTCGFAVMADTATKLVEQCESGGKPVDLEKAKLTLAELKSQRNRIVIAEFAT